MAESNKHILHGKYIGHGSCPDKFYLYASYQDGVKDLYRARERYDHNEYIFILKSVRTRYNSGYPV